VLAAEHEAERHPERRHLRQREVHEQHPAPDDVKSQVGVNAGQHQGGERRSLEERKLQGLPSSAASSLQFAQQRVEVREVAASDVAVACGGRGHYAHAAAAREELARVHREVGFLQQQPDLAGNPRAAAARSGWRAVGGMPGNRFHGGDHIEPEGVGEVPSTSGGT